MDSRLSSPYEYADENLQDLRRKILRAGVAGHEPLLLNPSVKLTSTVEWFKVIYIWTQRIHHNIRASETTFQLVAARNTFKLTSERQQKEIEEARDVCKILKENKMTVENLQLAAYGLALDDDIDDAIFLVKKILSRLEIDPKARLPESLRFDNAQQKLQTAADAVRQLKILRQRYVTPARLSLANSLRLNGKETAPRHEWNLLKRLRTEDDNLSESSSQPAND